MLERCQAGIISQERLEHLVRARRRQRVEPQLCVIGLAAPAMLVLRPIVRQQQEPCGRQALNQAIEQGLGFRVNPVQVFKDQQ